MDRTFVRTFSLVLCLLVILSNGQRFDFPLSLSRSPGLQVDGAGRVYSFAENRLYRLNSSLRLEEENNLSSEAVNISLSSDERWLVVCLTDLSCEVYNATNFSAGHVFRRKNVTTSMDNIALFATEDSFYVGGIVSGAQPMIVLGQYVFARNQGSTTNSTRSYAITRSGFQRNFYGSGFVRGSNTYYFATDNEPSSFRRLKVLRVCHNSDFGALYELSLRCGGRTPGSNTRISGVSVIDNFAGMSGPTVVLSTNRPLPSSQNAVCLYNLEAIDRRMQEKFDSCAAGSTGGDQNELSWRNLEPSCAGFQPTDSCHFGSSPFALDDVGNISFPLVGNVTIDLSQPGGNIVPRGNFVTASAAAIVESFLFVFVAYFDGNGVSYISGFSVKNTTTTPLFENQGFDKRTISDGPVRQLQLQSELGILYAVTGTAVMQFPIADCAAHPDCASCLGNGNPLCGWCVVENKCSRRNECQTSQDSERWIQAVGSNTDPCPTIMVSPEQYVMDNPQIITLTLSRNLPMLLENETYLCHFAGNEANFTVEAVGSGTTYMCNITGSIPAQYEGLSTVLNVSFISSLQGIPFSTNTESLTIYRCSASSSCSQCLQTNNACGWCVYNKVCSGTPAPCVNGTDNFLQLDLAMSQTFLDVCPLLDQPSPGVNYQQPVLVSKNIELVTRNLPPEINDFNYMCRVNGVNLQATYNNETSLTCSVNMNDLTLLSEVGQQSVDVTIQWVGQSINHPIDAATPVSVILYNCVELAGSCSSCLGSEFECGWCDRPNGMTDTCTYTGPEGCDATPVTEGANCPGPTITDFIPKSGPPEGGTTITIMGTDLGVSFSDFTASGNSITVGDVTCAPTNPENYMPGQRIDCITTDSGGSTGTETIMITLPNGRADSMNTLFRVVSPQITRVVPSRGPQAGGTRLTVYGSDLNIGNIEDTRITVTSGAECTVDQASIQATNITCTTLAFTNPATGPVMVMIDSATVNNNSVQFTYTPNPEFYSVTPMNTILGGGIELIFNGTNLDVVQNPMLVISDPEYLDVSNSTNCTVINSTAISCVTPPLTQMQSEDSDGVNYTIRVDNAPGPDLNIESLQISVLRNPGNFMLVDSEYNIGSGTVIRITGTDFNSVDDSDFSVTVGGENCTISGSVTPTQISCQPPRDPPGGNTRAIVVVNIGQYLSEQLSTPLSYVSNQPSPVPLIIIIPVVAGGLFIVVLFSFLIICCVVCYHRNKSKKSEQRWTNLLSQMELMELEMADECKRAFTELQTDLADLVQISDANLPYRDFRSFAMRVLFPQAGSNHPILLPLQLPEKTDQELVIDNLKSFQSLIMDKKFLLVFIHTLEGQGGRFTLQDKCTVASLLMVAFQNDLDFATEVLQTLLSELMRKSLNSKSHPKLLLRRTESVAEKMLANWLAFLLFPYLLEHVGQPLFTLYRAIKSQLEKGPVDIITGEARHSLSEEKLLRQHIEVKAVEGVIEPESGGDDIGIKMLDCDSITQAKEKVLDALYRNCPASKRPQLTEVDLTLQCGTASLTLRDQDQTNRREGEWTKINTLGHYNVDEMSQKHQNNPKLPIPRFKLERRPERPVSGASFDALGTIIANIGAESRGNMMTSGELSHIFHLVKNEPDEGDDVEKRGGKIMSEVFLTRLLSTKRILQPYVDAVFESIFTVPQGRPLPKAIKSLFDFLDLQASELGIQDPETLHTWKTNSVPLRFWVNVIKNPDFVFDIHKSATVDSCLTVIAQAYIDACSTAELRYSKDTPSARLLYVNEVKKYKQDVQQYYNSVQSQPKLSQYEMGEYLRETAQVCANSVEQVEPDIASHDLGPASMTRQLYFVQESALHELFKFAARYSEEIIDGLNEEGLSIMATNFQQLKSSIPV